MRSALHTSGSGRTTGTLCCWSIFPLQKRRLHYRCCERLLENLCVCDETQITFPLILPAPVAANRRAGASGDAEGRSLPPARLPSCAVTRVVVAFSGPQPS